MCLAVPGRILELRGSTAVVDVGGVRTEADVSLLDDVRVGDYVMVHTGFAIQKYDRREAEETLRLIREMVDREGV